MVNSLTKSKKGFTIIEVVLVLAIAGLIFLMVFIALPALQRNQRDTQRKSDIDRLQSSLISYVSNNNKLPTMDDALSSSKGGLPTLDCSTEADAANLQAAGECANYSKTSAGTFSRFIKDYFLSEGDTFQDPSGDAYRIVYGGAWDNKTAEGTAYGSGITVKTDGGVFEKFNDVIVLVTNASCSDVDGEPFTHYGSDGRRNFAVAMRLEAGGTYCVDN